jgi:hypothetical protein
MASYARRRCYDFKVDLAADANDTLISAVSVKGRTFALINTSKDKIVMLEQDVVNEQGQCKVTNFVIRPPKSVDQDSMAYLVNRGRCLIFTTKAGFHIFLKDESLGGWDNRHYKIGGPHKWFVQTDNVVVVMSMNGVYDVGYVFNIDDSTTFEALAEACRSYGKLHAPDAFPVHTTYKDNNLDLDVWEVETSVLFYSHEARFVYRGENNSDPAKNGLYRVFTDPTKNPEETKIMLLGANDPFCVASATRFISRPLHTPCLVLGGTQDIHDIDVTDPITGVAQRIKIIARTEAKHSAFSHLGDVAMFFTRKGLVELHYIDNYLPPPDLDVEELFGDIKNAANVF